jgi:hypothetical protein
MSPSILACISKHKFNLWTRNHSISACKYSIERCANQQHQTRAVLVHLSGSPRNSLIQCDILG